MLLPSPWVLNPPRDECGLSDQASAPAPASVRTLRQHPDRRETHSDGIPRSRATPLTSRIVDNFEEARVVTCLPKEAKLARDEAAARFGGPSAAGALAGGWGCCLGPTCTHTLRCFLASSQSFLARPMSPEP